MSSYKPVLSEIESKEELPWQLQMFERSLKKQQKLRALVGILGKVEGQSCMLITCGDNNGALNWHFKQFGGNWRWVDTETDSIEQIKTLTRDPVVGIDKNDPFLPFTDAKFDAIITIDVHEHLEHPQKLNLELARIVKPGGKVIVTTPNGDEKKLANRIKRLIGMRPEDYGHVVIGYDIPELKRQLSDVGLEPYATSSYAGFFTEILELIINFTYVKILSKRSKARVEKGQIAPQTQDQARSVEKSIKIYSLLYPLFLAISKLDKLTGSIPGYAVIVAARRGG